MRSQRLRRYKKQKAHTLSDVSLCCGLTEYQSVVATKPMVEAMQLVLGSRSLSSRPK